MITRNVTTECTHCRLPVPVGLIEPNQDEQFCCTGCRVAYGLIHSAGLEAFYRMVDSPAEQQTLRRRSADAIRFENFDDAGFLSRFAICLTSEAEAAAKVADSVASLQKVGQEFSELSRVQLPGVYEITLALEGIHCAACVWLVEKLPSIVPGVISAGVNWSKATVKIRWSSTHVSLSQIAAALYRLGYTPVPLRANEKASRRVAENRQHLIRIGIAAAAAGNNMLIATALYLGMFSGMESGYITLLRWASCVIGLASLLGPGRVFLRGAISALRTTTPHMDLPIALGLGVGSLAGLVNTIRGMGEIYFDSLSVLIFLLLVGRWIQFRQQNRAADSIELLYRLTPQRARKQVAGKWLEVVVEDIERGDLLQIRPGDLIAADAVVVEGSSEVDESILSGESKPASKLVGDELAAGTKNMNSLLIARATAVGSETRISKIVGLVEQASLDKPEIVQWANRIGGYFVVTIIVLAVITFGIWIPISSELAVDRAVALLIVACPCALAMATPLAISVALGRLARRRIMVKSGDVIQSLDRPGMIWLDKTGTLTEGRMQVVAWIGDRRWIPLVAAVESKFSHPIAKALAAATAENVEGGQAVHSFVEVSDEAHAHAFAAAMNWDEDSLTNITAFSNGVMATSGGVEVLIGNRMLLESSEIKIDSRWLSDEENLLHQNCSPCWVAVQGMVVGLVGLGDRIRADAKSFVAEMQGAGWSVGILSGDHISVVQAVAEELGIETFRAGHTPEQKVAVIQESQNHYPDHSPGSGEKIFRSRTVVMVGDGVNDSAALAAATVGIAVHGGAESSLAAAPIYLAESGLAPIRDLLSASKSTCRTIRGNFAASLGYNIVGAGLAMIGLINPLVAAILMPVSSLTVIALSLRSGRVKESGAN